MISAIILAGGKGKRVGVRISKQYTELNGRPILCCTLKRFVSCERVDRTILVSPKNEIGYCNKGTLEKYLLKVDMIVRGGRGRQGSVYDILQKINDSEIVLTHDGARTFISEEVIKDDIKYAKTYGATAPGVILKDTIRVVDENGFSDSASDRSKLLAIQTPQTSKLEITKGCHEKAKENNISATDDIMAAEMYNNKVYLHNGEYTNIKVIVPEGLIFAERLI